MTNGDQGFRPTCEMLKAGCDTLEDETRYVTVNAFWGDDRYDDKDESVVSFDGSFSELACRIYTAMSALDPRLVTSRQENSDTDSRSPQHLPPQP